MKREWKYPGKCCDCGCDTRSKYHPRCIQCYEKKRKELIVREELFCPSFPSPE